MGMLYSRDVNLHVDVYTDNMELAESIRRFISEAPIGDEYGVLSEADWENGDKYLRWLAEDGYDIQCNKNLMEL